MRMKMWMSSVTVSVCALMMCAVFPLEARASDTVPDGIYVGDVNLGGMTDEEADNKVREYVDSLANQQIGLDVDGTLVTTTAGELGFSWSNQEIVQETADRYKEGNLIRRYMNLKDLEMNPVELELETALDAEKVTAFVEAECNPLTAQAQDATITRENGAFVITPSVVGKTVDLEATQQALNEAVNEGLESPVQVKAVIEESLPAVTEDQLSSIQDVLGTFSTDFSSSGTSRSTNLKVGSGKINGHVLMPGETLSGYECMQPLTKANGYANAASYENGQVVDSVGGGVCQISTTLYNAALLSEMEITQRQNHSMVVGYVKPSNDAAIAGTYKDLKFKNPYDTPVYVEGGTSGRTLTFTIYGKETRPANRTIKFVSQTLSVTDPGEPINKVDNTLAPGAKVREQSSHRGIKSRLWKYVYVDGVETEKTVLHTDTYNASKAIYRVGPEVPVVVEPLPGETPAETPDVPAESIPQFITGEEGGPGVSDGSGTQPGSAPGAAPGSEPAPAPGSEPAPAPGPAPGSDPGSAPAPAPGADPGSAPAPGSEPAPAPGSAPGSEPAPAPGS